MLNPDVFKKIDPAIRNLMSSVNELSFVDKTLVSCSGHLDKSGNFVKSFPGFAVRYVAGKYDEAKDFHSQLKKVGGSGYQLNARGYPMHNYDPYTSEKVSPENGFQPSVDYMQNDVGEENQKLALEQNKDFDCQRFYEPISFLRDSQPVAGYSIELDHNSGIPAGTSLAQAWTDIDSVVSKNLNFQGTFDNYFKGFNPDGTYTGKFNTSIDINGEQKV